jgi:AraC-like DNA-binding protein
LFILLYQSSPGDGAVWEISNGFIFTVPIYFESRKVDFNSSKNKGFTAIQEHIRYPERLTIAVIAERFDLSPTYLGSYFRKQCNESLQQYISSYRIRLIEHRLRFSDKRVHEIADEFGFADESHVNKFFKRHQGMSLKQYRDSATKVVD